MPRPRRNGQSGVAVGMYWATRISSVGFAIVLPALLGYWLDKKWGTSPWLVVVGACLGFAAAAVEFTKLVQQQGKSGAKPGRPNASDKTS